MDWPAHLRETAAYLLEMAARPGWLAHAKYRRDALLADPAYTGLREEITRQRDLRMLKTEGSNNERNATPEGRKG